MNNRIFLGAVFAIALAIGGYVAWGPSSTPQASSPLAAASAQEAGAVDLSQIQEMVLGDADAPVTIIEYASYTCPHCRRFHETTFKNIMKDYVETGKVRFVYREVYFDRFGLWASIVARCGGERNSLGSTIFSTPSNKHGAKAPPPTSPPICGALA